MTAAQAAGAGDAVGLERAERGGERRDPGQMRAVCAGADGDVRTAVEEKRDVAALDNGRDRLRAVDQRALVAVLQAQQHRGDIAGVERRGKRARKRFAVADRRGDQINPLARGLRAHHAIRPRAAGEDFLSVTPLSVPESACHWPSAARPFIAARWPKARCAAATFSALPDQAFCGAACSARP